MRFRETPQDSALRVDLQDAPSYGVAHIKDVVRRDDKATGMPYATFMVAMETTIVATGMQGIGGQLGGFAYYSWILSSYALSQCPRTVNSPSAYRHEILRIPSPFNFDV